MKMIRQMVLATTVIAGLSAFTSNAANFNADVQQSKITWKGKKVTGEHSGTISLKSGHLSSNGKAITGGGFIIDMPTIKDADLADETYKAKLEGHLKSDDFFGVEKFPTATFEITNAVASDATHYTIKGKLTIKGVTKEISFPSTVTAQGNKINASADIKIDRTQFGIKYGSGSFFDNLGDKAIDNEFTMHVDLITTN